MPPFSTDAQLTEPAATHSQLGVAVAHGSNGRHEYQSGSPPTSDGVCVQYSDDAAQSRSGPQGKSQVQPSASVHAQRETYSGHGHGPT